MVEKLAKLIEEKQRIIKELSEIIGKNRVEKVVRDHHARRKPRHCGITIHTGIGCGYGCTYCYIWDMGFPGKPKPYPLEPQEMAYALAANPYVVPGRTMAAYGSVTEPFQDETRNRAIDYIKTIYDWLHLPSQVSTKSLLDSKLIQELKASDPGISILVTIIAISEEARRLEPRAPPPEERIVAAGEASRKGLRVALFMRPIIPTITDRQAEEILDLAMKSGIRDIVLGSLRVTPRIIETLSKIGVPRSEILRRLPKKPRTHGEQVTLRMNDIKNKISRVALRMGFKVYPSACSHNMNTHSTPCYACKYGPCGHGKPVPPSPEEIIEAIEAMGGRVFNVEVKYPRIIITGLRNIRKDVIAEFLSAATKLIVTIKK